MKGTANPSVLASPISGSLTFGVGKGPDPFDSRGGRCARLEFERGDRQMSELTGDQVSDGDYTQPI